MSVVKGGRKRDWKTSRRRNKAAKAHYREMARQGKANGSDGEFRSAIGGSHLIAGYNL